MMFSKHQKRALASLLAGQPLSKTMRRAAIDLRRLGLARGADRNWALTDYGRRTAEALNTINPLPIGE